MFLRQIFLYTNAFSLGKYYQSAKKSSECVFLNFLYYIFYSWLWRIFYLLKIVSWRYALLFRLSWFISCATCPNQFNNCGNSRRITKSYLFVQMDYSNSSAMTVPFERRSIRLMPLPFCKIDSFSSNNVLHAQAINSGLCYVYVSYEIIF